MRREIGLLWRIHALAYLMVRPVAINVTAKHGLSLIEWRIVISLARVRDSTANEIIDLWGLEKMAVSRGVRRLLGAGLIKRTRDKKDNRRLLLNLTSKGQRFHAAAWPSAEEHYRSVSSALTSRELKQFEVIADKLISKSEEIFQDLFSRTDSLSRRRTKPA